MITGKQIAAARGLLGWTQEDLAYKSGITRSAIQKIERQEVDQPRISTLNKISEALEKASIEFIEDGVRVRKDAIQVFNGADAFNKIQDDILYTLKDTGGEVLYKFSDEAYADDLSTQKDIALREQGIKMRFLVKNGDTNLMFPLGEYRWISKKYFKDNLQVIYGDKFATIIGGHKDTTDLKILLVHDPILAEMSRNDFELYWELGQEPTQTTSEAKHD